ncbi:fatty acid oxidation complex subunit alpha FadB [Azospirillum sp.]|uniref:fatty acid oxidation complex subunit alpha FadB n=1 Tax=Azospirillum sp. TaxID=34012 RepID=UPI002D493C74|nr:fatty acid oxidation complex subunit alpha FadB [Azospirillum sp.]HYD66851.1 fatty acid oxidation complex subunit alpha FadB [Azospirillum sp.]
MHSGQSVQVLRLDGGIAEIRFGRAGRAVNALDALTFAELKAALADVRAAVADGLVTGVLLTSGKGAFIVGADITEFTALFARPAAEVAALALANGAILGALEELPVPSVAAVNGLALGGGLELALAADQRVLAATAQVGLPEVRLGIIPGLGGTVRLPRLAGLAEAATWITDGRPRDAGAALAAGVATLVAEPERLRDTALGTLRALIAEPDAWRAARAARSGPVVAAAVATADLAPVRAVVLRAHAHVPAGRRVVDLLERTAGMDKIAALAAEADLLGEVVHTQAADALVRVFLNDQAVKRKGRGYRDAGRPVRRAAVLGAGIMGGGIAYTSAARGVPVILKDIVQRALDLGMAEAGKLAAKQVAAGRMTAQKADAVVSSIRPQLDYAGFAETDVAVEAVVEDIRIKKAVLAEVEAAARADTIIASNTSSLPIGDLAAALRRPENFVGMHFFNPVPVMPLVEVIRGPKTSDEAAATVASYALAMGKVPVVVKDCPGFLVNRIFTPYVLGFLRLIADGADFRAVDRAAEAFGWPMGPAYLQDVIGMDTSNHVLEIITAGYPERMAGPARHAVSLMVENGRLGQKSGRGFYRYEPDDKGRPRKLPDDGAHVLLAAIQPGGTRDFTDAEIVDRLMLPMIVEAACCLEDGIAGSAAEIDMALVLGLGFPRHVAGPLAYADWLGMEAVVAACGRHAALGALYRPTAAMRAMAAEGGRFYAE